MPPHSPTSVRVLTVSGAAGAKAMSLQFLTLAGPSSPKKPAMKFLLAKIFNPMPNTNP